MAKLVYAKGGDPHQDQAGVRTALRKIRNNVPDLMVAKSTFFALADANGVAIRNDLEEDVMAGQNLFSIFPALAKSKDAYVTATGVFPNSPSKNGPDEDWIAGTPVKRDDKEAPAVVQSRAFFEGLGIPVWAGQVSQRTGFVLTLAAGASIGEVAPQSAAGTEMNGLWSAVERSIAAINTAHAAARAAQAAA